MKFDTKYRIDEACSKDETRPHLTHVELDGNRMIATNGYVAASVPCDPEPGDRNGPLPVGAIREARSTGSVLRGRFGHFISRMGRIRARKTVLDVNDRVMYRRPKTTFPPAGRELANAPKFGNPGTFSVTLNPLLLLAAARAIGRTGAHDYVTLTFDTSVKGEYLAAVGISTGNELAEAVVMPARR